MPSRNRLGGNFSVKQSNYLFPQFVHLKSRSRTAYRRGTLNSVTEITLNSSNILSVMYRFQKVACYHLDTEQGPVIWKRKIAKRVSHLDSANFKLSNSIQILYLFDLSV